MIETPQYHDLQSEGQTRSFAHKLAAKLEPGDIILLQGDLGAGKTTLAREVIRSLTKDADKIVPSPTFTLVQSYESDKMDIWHFDLYRLSDPSEIFELGWQEALTGPVVLVEWPDRLGDLTPDQAVRITITRGKAGPESRHVEITGS